MKKTITVFTPTYNRANTLYLGYEALKRQTSKDFKWLIIDDGSTDNTKNIVEQWKKEGVVEIEYIYKENGGMHTGYNKAYQLIDTELNVCVDSDDYLTDDAIENIINCWKNNGEKKYAGIIALDGEKNGKILGRKFPSHLKSSTLENLYYRYKIGGDKKLVYRTDVVKRYPPYPEFGNESFVPLGILYLMIDKEYEMLLLNEVICIVEYMQDGSSKNILKQYRRHPKGFRYSRLIAMKYSNFEIVKIKAIIHFISHNIQLKKYNIFKENPYPIKTLFLIPFGVLLHLYIYYKNINPSQSNRLS